jgi:two-component system sensor histidine kinase AlgZ
LAHPARAAVVAAASEGLNKSQEVGRASLWILIGETWGAQAEPRRLLPAFGMALALFGAQTIYSPWLGAQVQALALIAFFGLTGPTSWRITNSFGKSWLWALWFPLSGLSLMGVALLVPVRLELPSGFLAEPGSLGVVLSLYWTGAWGLGRDIELQKTLEAAQARQAQLEIEKERAQLLAIRGQLDPHFLFNTLNAIAEWTREDPIVAEQAILRLSRLLRLVLEGLTEAAWAAERELGILEDLAELWRIRDPSRFQLTVRKGDLEGARVPPMLLLPLMENALKHGPGAGYRGEMVLELGIRADQLRMCIENPGPPGGEREGGQGRKLLERRLQATYGADVKLPALQPSAGGGTRVELWIPVQPTIGLYT